MDLSQFTPEQLNQLRQILSGPAALSAPAAGANAGQPSHTPASIPNQHTLHQAGPTPSQPAPQALYPNLQVPNTLPRAQPFATAPPITQIYTGSRSQATIPVVPVQSAPSAYPVATQAASTPSTFQPFLGAAGLGLNLATGHANQARLALSQSHSSSQPTLAIRGSQTGGSSRGRGTGRRGNAGRLPSLSQELPIATLRQQCLVADALESILVTVKILFPLIQTGQEFVAYRFLRTSVNTYLTENHLLYHHTLPSAFRVVDLIAAAAADMQNSQLAYQFAPLREGVILADHEKLPLYLLAYKARGQIRQAKGSIGLVGAPTTPDVTIKDILYKAKFSPREAFEDGRFVIYLAVASLPFSAIVDGRRHSCIANRFYRLFSTTDSQYSQPSADTDDDYCSGGEDIAPAPSSDIQEEEAVSRLLTPTPSQQQAQTSRQQSRGGLRREESLLAAASFLPATIWSAGWSPAVPDGEVYTAAKLHEQVFAAAHSGPLDPIKFVATGTSAAALADNIDQQLSAAASNGDFTNLLSPERDIRIVSPAGETISMGPGIEREAFYTVFARILQDPATDWIQYHRDARASIQVISPLASSRFAPLDRLLGAKKLGAIAALLLILGGCPAPLDPCIFQFAIHNRNLEAIHPTFLGEWHPKLRVQLLEWNNLGPDSDITAFDGLLQETLGFGASSLGNYAEASHKPLGPALLYYSIFGPEPPYHPEWKAFFDGFSLPCRNGFSFLSVPRMFEGGSETFFSLFWTSHIQGYESLLPFLRVKQPSGPATVQLGAVLAGSVKDMVHKFLQGSGIPCQKTFDQQKATISPIIDLSLANTPAFRSRMLAWAATGSPFVDPDSDMIIIHTIEQSDLLYAGSLALNPALMAQDTVSFRTCTRSVRLPGPYIAGLAARDYPPIEADEPQDFIQAFESWLFIEILTAVGSHSML